MEIRKKISAARRAFLKELMIGNEDQITHFGYWMRGLGKECSGEAYGLTRKIRNLYGGDLDNKRALVAMRNYVRDNPVLDDHDGKTQDQLAWDVTEYMKKYMEEAA